MHKNDLPWYIIPKIYLLFQAYFERMMKCLTENVSLNKPCVSSSLIIKNRCLFRQNHMNSLIKLIKDGYTCPPLLLLNKEYRSVYHSSLLCLSSLSLLDGKMGLYFSFHPWGCSRDILQPSHVPHKTCQWWGVRTFPRQPRLLMHSNTLHYNGISHQQHERVTRIERWKEQERSD